MVPDRLEKIDEASVYVVVDLDFAGRFCEEDAGGTAEYLNVDLVRWEKFDKSRGYVELAATVGERGHSLSVTFPGIVVSSSACPSH